MAVHESDVYVTTYDEGPASVRKYGADGYLARTFTLGHSYAAAGTYTATVTVRDDDGGAGTASLSAVVFDDAVTIADLVASTRTASGAAVSPPSPQRRRAKRTGRTGAPRRAGDA